jgi:hypothetical protein
MLIGLLMEFERFLDSCQPDSIPVVGSPLTNTNRINTFIGFIFRLAFSHNTLA